ncbi:MAG: hypothetical protein ACOY4T_09495 [Pseudomonadota bacterium]
MRDFFIGYLEKVLNVLVVLAFLALLIVAGIAAAGGGEMGRAGPLAGLFILIVGAIYLVVVFGFLYLGLGIYQNTKRTAEALERNPPR